MRSQRTLLGLVAALLIAAGAAAQAPVRWLDAGPGKLGLQAGPADFRLNLQVGAIEATPMDRMFGRAPAQGLKLSLAPQAGWASDLAIQGRFGTLSDRAARIPGLTGSEGGLSYGVGLSWNFSPRLSAVLGWDSYDFRTAAGERDVRATSLGLQLRY